MNQEQRLINKVTSLLEERLLREKLIDSRTIPRQCGKTALAVKLAKERNCPLIVPDYVSKKDVTHRDKKVEVLTLNEIIRWFHGRAMPKQIIIDEISLYELGRYSPIAMGFTR